MKKKFILGLSSLLPFFMINETAAQSMPNAKMSSTTSPSSTMEGSSKLEPLQTKPHSTTRKEEMPSIVKRPSLVHQKAQYLHPGILVFFNGKWEGSDHLLNVSNNIGVNVTIIKPESEILEITEGQIQKTVEDIFSLAGISPQTLVQAGKPPLPTFQIEIFVYPVEKGYVAAAQGRLFESVILERFKMDPSMSFQAITWEKQHLIVGPKAQFPDQLTKIVEDLATTFTDRFQIYEKLKKSGNL